jgi:long-chain fatty acid transport protein
MKNSKRLLALAVAAACGAPMAAFATNGMNLEGYGPIATAMGGASMAYDNGTAAVMNNPATLGLAADGSRLDVAVGVLGPNVDATHSMGGSWSSGGDSYMMPAVGWAKKNGQLTYGVGAFAQGGMGTEYNGGGPGTAFVMSAMADPSLVAGWKERSEVGVMRILFPLAFNVNDKLTVGGSLDYVRATMDLQMAMTAGVMGDMMMNPNSTVGTISGNLTGDLVAMIGGNPANLRGGYFDFSDNSDYDGKTSGDGFAAKVGFTYQVSNQLTVGGSYHSETSISDLSGNASMQVAFDNGGEAVATMAGKIKIKDFQWPATYGVGLSYVPNDKWMIAGDVKFINWSSVMKNFKMSFTADANGHVMDATMYQNWDDQTVFQLGAAYKATDAFTVRFGANLGNNPIPADTLHYLFPATIENHYTAGFGYKMSAASDVNFSLQYAPEVAVTGTNATSNQGLKVTHAQTSWQLMYSHRF